MNQRERHQKLTTGLGRKLNDFLNEALTDADHLPGKRALKALIAEEFGETGLNVDKLEEAFVDMARRGQDRSARFGLRGVINETVVTVVTKLDEEDRLVTVEENTPEEIKEAADKASDPYADRIGGALARAHDEEVAKARDLIRMAQG